MVFMGTEGRALVTSGSADDRFGVRFELQAIANANDLAIYGYEFLYRGAVRPTSTTAWVNVDHGVLKYLAAVSLGLGKPFFINLSHESFVAIPDSAFFAASEKNELRFELSEAVAEGGLFDEVCDKVNRLIGCGMHFAIDDFGAGLDGSRRLYALDKVAVIKVDRGLLISAAGRSNAAKMLAASVVSWKAAGIRTVAEGVETADLLAFAQGVGFDLVQGWHVDTFVPAEQAVISRSFF